MPAGGDRASRYSAWIDLASLAELMRCNKYCLNSFLFSVTIAFVRCTISFHG
jgi:hypothetical protein